MEPIKTSPEYNALAALLKGDELDSPPPQVNYLHTAERLDDLVMLLYGVDLRRTRNAFRYSAVDNDDAFVEEHYPDLHKQKAQVITDTDYLKFLDDALSAVIVP